jgi:hypothetical protein
MRNGEAHEPLPNCRSMMNGEEGRQFVCIRLLGKYLFTRYLLGQKYSKPSAASHKDYSKPEAFETDQLTNSKTCCDSKASPDHTGQAVS